jgi:hypothetical protein
MNGGARLAGHWPRRTQPVLCLCALLAQASLFLVADARADEPVKKCKGDRVWVDGECVDRPAEPPAPPPVTPAPLPAPALPKAPDASVDDKPETKTRLKMTGPAVGVELTQRLSSEDARQAWLKRGGSLISYALSGAVTAMYLPQLDARGAGLGASFSVGLLNLSPPDIDKHEKNFFGYRLGLGAQLSAFQLSYYLKKPTLSGTTVTYTLDQQSVGSQQLLIPGYIGIQGGLGNFDSLSQWSGWTFAIDWAPSYQLQLNPSGGGGNFNYLGFNLDIQHGSMHAALQKVAAEAQFKISFFMLPPIGDLPFFATIGLGAVWY